MVTGINIFILQGVTPVFKLVDPSDNTNAFKVWKIFGGALFPAKSSFQKKEEHVNGSIAF